MASDMGGNGDFRCEHQASQPEGVHWPVDVSLSHFDSCLTHDQRLDFLTRVLDGNTRGTRCWQADHVGRLVYLEQANARLWTRLHRLARRILQGWRDETPPDPCPVCRGTRWVDDEGWQPEYRGERRTDLRNGDYVGMLPCPECNWDRQHATLEDARL